jgi:hypothetical protein
MHMCNESQIYKVVVNDAAQYSIRYAKREGPVGKRPIGQTARMLASRSGTGLA